MNRTELRQLAEDRLLDARALLDSPGGVRASAAYYLAGYALECGLKACILARIEREGVIFDRKDEKGKDNKRFSEQCFTHDLLTLIGLAGLVEEHNASLKTNPRFTVFWLVAEQWDEQSRYQQKTEAEAEALWEAITDAQDGLLSWIKTHW